MDLEGVEVFVRVVEAGSFTEAGRQLSLPKSTVSRRISRLEDSLGVRLLQRSTRKIALTEAGQAYFHQVAPALTAVRAADARVGEMQSAPSGVVRVTAPFDFGTHFLGDIVAAFTAQYPEISVDVHLSHHIVDLIAEGFDVAFRGGWLEDSSLVARSLGRGKGWLVAIPSYLERHPPVETPGDLEKHECILFRSAEEARWTLDGPDGATETVPVRGRINGDEFGFLKSVVLAGGGIAILPWLLARTDVEAGRLVRVLPEWGSPGGHMSLIYPSAQYLPQRVVAFRDFVLAWAKMPPWATVPE